MLIVFKVNEDLEIKMTMDKISIAIWAILYYKLNLEKLIKRHAL